MYLCIYIMILWIPYKQLSKSKHVRNKNTLFLRLMYVFLLKKYFFFYKYIHTNHRDAVRKYPYKLIVLFEE